jgi:uncharacterized repeat protein (TIGR01451 family)
MKLDQLKKAAIASAFSAAMVFASASTFAKTEGSQVEGTLEQNRIVLVDGKESLASAEKVSPGDTLLYRVRYSNNGTTPANNLVVTLPIPKGLEYQASPELPKAALASLDGDRFEAIPIKRLVKSGDGRETLKEVPLSEYRALRWTVDQLQGGKSVLFSARARVERVAEKVATK